MASDWRSSYLPTNSEHKRSGFKVHRFRVQGFKGCIVAKKNVKGLKFFEF